MFNKSTLMLEGITLAQMVQLVVEMLVDFAGSAVLDQEAAENAKAAHPHDLAAVQEMRISKLSCHSVRTTVFHLSS